jgi:hypothetical protein
MCAAVFREFGRLVNGMKQTLSCRVWGKQAVYRLTWAIGAVILVVGAGGAQASVGSSSVVVALCVDDATSCKSGSGGGNNCGVSLPVTDKLTATGGSWVQFRQTYLNADSGEVFADWGLSTSTLNNGANRYIMGIQVESSGSTVSENVKRCQSLGIHPHGFQFIVDAGADGWSSSSSCSSTASWEVSVGVEFSFTGPGISGTASYGESKTCGDGKEWDSEVLIHTSGSADHPPCSTVPVPLSNNPCLAA